MKTLLILVVTLLTLSASAFDIKKIQGRFHLRTIENWPGGSVGSISDGEINSKGRIINCTLLDGTSESICVIGQLNKKTGTFTAYGTMINGNVIKVTGKWRDDGTYVSRQFVNNVLLLVVNGRQTVKNGRVTRTFNYEFDGMFITGRSTGTLKPLR